MFVCVTIARGRPQTGERLDLTVEAAFGISRAAATLRSYKLVLDWVLEKVFGFVVCKCGLTPERKCQRVDGAHGPPSSKRIVCTKHGMNDELG